MDVLTAARMREADRRTIEEAGIPSRVLMENAGREAARVVSGLVRERVRGGGRILILCGRGGNGGDGLVILRALAERGLAATAVVLASADRLAPDTRANLETAQRLGLDVREIPDEDAWRRALGDRPLGGSPLDVIVDAILGTGVTRPLEGLLERVVLDLESRFEDVARVAVDIPTGLATDSGALPRVALRADVTVALAAAKVCHVVFPASSACGELRVARIGIPDQWLSSGPEGLRAIGAPEAAELLPTRAPGAHKGELGRLLLVAGSRRMPGAAALAARGALAAGVGLLTVAGPSEALTGLPPEAMRLPLPAGEDGQLAPEAAAVVSDFAGSFRADALAVGPGLGGSDACAEAVRRLVAATTAPAVLDADGLNAFAGRAEELREREGLALTPHGGEGARLLGATPPPADRLAAARVLARATGSVVAYKGPGTLVAAPDGAASVNLSGGPELATGGSGDVLTGVAGTLLARGLSPTEALGAAVFVHGAAGAEASRRLGADAVTASEIAAAIGGAMQRLQERKQQ